MPIRRSVRSALFAMTLPLSFTNCSAKSDDATAPVVPTTGAFTWTESGASRTGVVQAHTLQVGTGSSAGKYTVTLTAATAAGGSISNNDFVTLSLINMTGPGTYALGINTTTGVLASATFNRNRTSSPTAIWGAGPGLAGGAGSGTITVSSFNATARTVAGTFTFVGGPVTNTNGVNTVTVTNGAFNVVIP